MTNQNKLKQEFLDELKKGGEKTEKLGFALGKGITTIQRWAYYNNKQFIVPVYIPALLSVFGLTDESELFEQEEDIDCNVYNETKYENRDK